MNKKIGKIIILGIVTFLCFLKAAPAFGLELQYPSILGFSVNDTSTLSDYVKYFFNIGMALAVIIAVGTVAAGGVYYLISYGKGKFTDEGKSWIKSGLLGLLIIFCAYLIMYTINPGLLIFNIETLSGIPMFNPSSGNGTTPAGKITTYNEIPIGVLAENLLTKTMNCYAFDPSGNPIDGERATTDNNRETHLPTYMYHDRVDCLVQLADGAQKKSQVIAELSDEIMRQMKRCDCRTYGNCNPECGGQCDEPTRCPGGRCTGDCVGGACLNPPAPPDCCPVGVKDQIEHGQMNIGGNNANNACGIPAKTYSGLDEFRCPNPKDSGSHHTPCSDIAGFVEKQIQVGGETITIIDQNSWAQLNLIQQLTYFREKIDEIKQKIQDDADELSEAKSALGRCYLAVSYIDLLKTYEKTDQQRNAIIISKTFTDQESGDLIDASKYCKGFNYGNSSCLKKCNDVCPDASDQAMQAYKECDECGLDDTDCLESQERCIEDAYNSRPCIYQDTENGGTPQNFEECINSCQNDCKNICSDKYLQCSSEYTTCNNLCDDNSQCVLDEADDCLFGSRAFRECADTATDQSTAQDCISDAYLCEHGSNEYAGYPDCTNAPVEDYSSSAIYDSDNQKCPKPYDRPTRSSACYSAVNTSATCQELCPETTKCPAGSRCPSCPCEQIDQSPEFSIPNESNEDNVGQEGYITREERIIANMITSPQCDELSYNDDPLTFYCQDQWWNDPKREGVDQTPIGTKRMCPLEKEVPVGQMVDDAESWADDTIEAIGDINEDIQNIIDQMDKIGKAKDTSPIQDYCKCNAKLEDSNPICKTDCQYHQWYDFVNEEWECACTFVPCEGNPCEQIIKYLSELWNYYRDFKLEFIDFYLSMLVEPRSDIMKELTYSRQTTDDCSLARSLFGLNARLFSCTRVEDELMAPINTGQIDFDGQTIDSYCYGTDLGNLFNESLMDNWFCCQQY